jgi:D-alanyl-D-alanine carboxypeptidase
VAVSSAGALPVRIRLLAALFAAALLASALVSAGILAPLRAAGYSGSPPACSYADVLTPHRSYTDWARTLLDTKYMVPRAYVPADLVSVSRAGISGAGYVRSLVIADLKAMTAAAKAASAPLAVQSAYRSYASQVTTFNYWVSVSGYSAALKASARPGHSEHQLGTTIDFKSYGGSAPWNYTNWATTRAGAWMAASAWKYGWVMSYPKAFSPAQTCYSFEPWHFRYLGRVEAKAIHYAAISPRLYLWHLQ